MKKPKIKNCIKCGGTFDLKFFNPNYERQEWSAMHVSCNKLIPPQRSVCKDCRKEIEKFYRWQKEFKNSQKGALAFHFLFDNIEEEYGGNPSNEIEAQQNVGDRILKACYNAAIFKDTSHEKRMHDKSTIDEIEGEGRNQVKAIKELRNFIKRYPDASNWAIIDAIGDLYKDGLIIKDLSEHKGPGEPFLDKLLAAYEVGLKKYTMPKFLAYWSQSGCLSFPKPIDKKRSDPALDGLIFELAFHLKRYKSSNPTMVLAPGVPFPKTRRRLTAQNEIIAKFVNAALNKKLNSKHVKNRIDKLRKQGARFTGWHYAEVKKKKIKWRKPIKQKIDA